MDEQQSLNHSKWECKYHVVFIPKCRRQTLYAQLRRYLGEVFRKLAEQKESRIEEGHLMPYHVHMGTRVFCIDGWPGRRGDPELHPQSGRGGQAAGSDASLAIARPLQWPHDLWGRVTATPSSRLQAAHTTQVASAT